ncbi:hypothetical protein [Fuchsiella alkaliacetigena]|nr:hypothetical protein [Fuchsiella alkaliacetigena]
MNNEQLIISCQFSVVSYQPKIKTLKSLLNPIANRCFKDFELAEG